MRAALTTMDRLGEDLELTEMTPAAVLAHLDADRDNHAALIDRGDDRGLLAVWTSADGRGLASGLLPLDDPNDCALTERDVEVAVWVWDEVA